MMQRLLAFFILVIPIVSIAQQAPPDWTMSGQNLSNSRSQATETKLSVLTVPNLVPKWSIPTGTGVSATPAVYSGAVYFPDWGGNLYKVDAVTGNYTSMSLGSVSRTTPTLWNDNTTQPPTTYLFVATQQGAGLMKITDNLQVDTTFGTAGTVQLDPHPAAQITQSPVVYNGVVYIGVSSQEENFASDTVNHPNYQCCTFRGSIVAVNASSGAILWKTYMVPDNGGQSGGYSGAAVWGSTPVVDQARNSLYITTGNNYSVPQSVLQCASGTTNPRAQAACLNSKDYADAVVALDLTTGSIKWANSNLAGLDVWNDSCRHPNNPNNNCPNPSGLDYDFGQGPMLVKNITVSPNKVRDLVLAGQKSGTFWAFEAATGKTVWSTNAGPGGLQGGMEWGSANDGKTIYYADANYYHSAYKLKGGSTTTAAFWGALDIASGKIIWQIADPNIYATDTGPVSVANGVVYVGSQSGFMFALSAQNGKIAWQSSANPAVGPVNAGPAIVDGALFWGSGYRGASGAFFKFGLP